MTTMKIVLFLAAVAAVYGSDLGCGENQHYKSCGTACPLTCKNYENPPKFCIMMCKSGCFCDDGYVKAADGKCVKPENCPAEVNPNAKTCLEEPETGVCRGYFPMWNYDVQSGTCKMFIFGGCGGNSNRYATEEECLENCKNAKVKQSASDVCSLPAEVGLCKAYIPRYHFDPEIGDCKRFVYGGCGGNANNFKTLSECQETCLPDDEE